jgi:hypothetical protein
LVGAPGLASNGGGWREDAARPHAAGGIAMRYSALAVAAIIGPLVSPAQAGFTNDIMLTGYWPPTNEMLRPFSTNPAQNPGGWIGENWEGRGYNIHSFFPEVQLGGKGTGDFEVDYQDTSPDWWRITAEVRPVAIITFSWTPGNAGHGGKDWELEVKNKNRTNWSPDYEAPFYPDVNPPDGSVPAGYERTSTLPLWPIRVALAQAQVGVSAYLDTGTGGTFLSEYIGYHGLWYQSIHSDPNDPSWCVAAGHIHVGQNVTIAEGFAATEVTLRTLIDYVDTIVPEPASLGLLLVVAALRRGGPC